MKYCINAHNSPLDKEKADEIFINFQDRKILIDYVKNYSDKVLILEIKSKEFTDEIKSQLLTLTQIDSNIVCQLDNMLIYDWFKDNNIKYYYKFPVNSFYEVQGLIDLGVEYISIYAPLTFKIPLLKKYNVKFRMVPNMAYSHYIPRKDGIKGQWVRPEDVQYYEDAIYIFDFETGNNYKKESGYFKIYSQDKQWPGNLNLLIQDLNYNTDNRGILEGLGERRSRCGQRCFENKQCNFCELALEWPQTVTKYMKNKE